MTSPLYTTMPLSTAPPSFYELHMADRLHRSLSPAFGQVVQALVTAGETNNSPQQAWYQNLFARMINMTVQYLDEADTLVLGALQAHSLWANDSLLSERLYQLRRAKVVAVNSNSNTSLLKDTPSSSSSSPPTSSPPVTTHPLDNSDRWRILLWEVALPYLRRKADYIHSQALENRRHQRRYTLPPPSQQQEQQQQDQQQQQQSSVEEEEGEGEGDSSHQRQPFRRHRFRQSLEFLTAYFRNFLIWLWPRVSAALEAAGFLSQFYFLAGASPYFHWHQRPLLLKSVEALFGSSSGGGGVLQLGLNQVYVRANTSPLPSSFSSSSSSRGAPHSQGAMKSTPATMAAAATPGPEPQRCSSSSGGNGGGEAVAVQQRRLTYARMAVLGVVVGFKALEWWHRAGRAATEEAERAARAEEDEAESEAGEGQRRRRVRPIPPPPAPPPFPAGAVPLPLESGLCPLCLQPRANAAASPGGVTFCYRCLAQYVAEHKQCPVTWVPCKPSGIRRLFDQ